MVNSVTYYQILTGQIAQNNRGRLLGKLSLHVHKQAYMPEFIAALPVSGYDGTIAHRFNNTPLVGRAHIITGLLDFVQSMAG